MRSIDGSEVIQFWRDFFGGWASAVRSGQWLFNASTTPRGLGYFLAYWLARAPGSGPGLMPYCQADG